MARERVKYFLPEQKNALLRILKLRKDAERSFALLDLMFNTALRLAEAYALNVGDIKDRLSLKIVGKGKKIREIPLNQAIREHLANYLKWKARRGESIELNAPLFISRKGNRLSKRAIQRDLDKWVNLAGIQEHFSPHALRHSVATELLAKTNNLKLVQAFLGHSDISTTQIYTHISQTQLAQASELLSSPTTHIT